MDKGLEATYLTNVVHAYDAFLEAHESEVPDAIEKFEAEIHKSNVKFGRFTIPSYFKPHFLTPVQQNLLKRVSVQMVRLLRKVTELYFTEPIVTRMFQLSPEARSLVEIDPGYASNVVLTRLDSFMEGLTVKFFELNCDSPAGMGYADVLEEILFRQPLVAKFAATLHLRHESRAKELLRALMDCYTEFGGTERPHIAIVDWRTVRTRSEFEILKEIFEAQGHQTVICDPRDLRFRHGKLYADEFRVDLVYRRVISSELLEKLDEVEDFVKAYRERAVCVINPFRSRLAGSKSVLSVLTNPGFDHLFTEAENRLKYEHIPWTRRISDAERFYGGKKVYLIDFLKDEKESLVLKPSEGYGGKNVTVGCETPNDEWNRVIDRAVREDWVVQEYVSIPTMSVPLVRNGRLEFEARKVSINPFAFGERFAGSISRMSEDSVINVSHSGGLAPAVPIEEVHER